MAEYVFEFLQFADGVVTHEERGSAPDLATAHHLAQLGLYNVNAYVLATAYRIRDPVSGRIVGTSGEAPSARD